MTAKILLSCRSISKDFAERNILKNVNLDIAEGERIGLVGVNGAGKTTLANILVGAIQPDGGHLIQARQGIQIGYLLQSTAYTTNHFAQMLHEQDDVKQIEEFLKICSTLGLQQVQDWDAKRFQGLSGGEKTKLALANIWMTKPDLLIMDEPTNHLDFQAVEWLIAEMAAFQGALLIISHNRYFLDRSVQRIIELDGGEIRTYAGNYTFYREEKARQYESQLHQYNVEKKRQTQIEAEINQLQNWSEKAHRTAGKKGTAAERRQMGLREFERVKAKKMDKQVKSKLKRLESMRTNGVAKPQQEQQIYFQFDDASKHGRSLIEAREIEIGYHHCPLIRDSSFTVLRGERVGIIGKNGSGKTTLLRILLGQLSVQEGEIWVSPSAKMAYLSQDVNDLAAEDTIAQLLEQATAQERTEMRTLLANMGFAQSMFQNDIRTFSLGEQTRLKIAMFISQANNILILDEPTNHLDLHSREQLERTLETYRGTLLLVTHDRYMLERLCNKLLVFEHGQIRKFEGSFQEYTQKLESPARQRNKRTNDKANQQEELIVLENRIAYVLGQLSQLTSVDPAYAKFDAEAKQLMQQKRELTAKS